MGIPLLTPIDTCTCPWCTRAIAGEGTFLLPPPMPPTTAYAGAAWTLVPPLAGTDEATGAARPTTPILVDTPIIPANIGTPFAEAIGFRNPFLDAAPTDRLPVHDARIDPTT